MKVYGIDALALAHQRSKGDPVGRHRLRTPKTIIWMLEFWRLRLLRAWETISKF